jgi:SAM-dependent methyltransferase
MTNTNEKWREEWLSEKEGKEYGDLFFRRAVGEVPEMESSKAAAKRMADLVRAGDTVIDVGCGAGHYYRSLRKAIQQSFNYIGVDQTPYYIARATEAYKDDINASFKVGDIYDLPMNDSLGDVVMCNNVLLHLPNVAKPLTELVRVAKRYLLIRTLIGPKSYIVMDVAPVADGRDFDEAGVPTAFHYLNIYSENYIRHILSGVPRVRDIAFAIDTDFDAARIADTGEILSGAWDVTRVVNGTQVSGMIIQPWTWVTVTLD